jgi:branched-chain amino acid transport system substrate-binding protein
VLFYFEAISKEGGMKRINRKASVVISIISILIASLMVLSFGCAKKEDKEIKIGAIFPLSGDAQRIGNMKKDGADLAADEINMKGGIKGVRFITLYEDSQNEPSKGVSAFKKLSEVDKVPVIMSAMSGVSMALAPIAGKQRIVLFANVGHPAITGQNEWVFRNFPTAEQEAKETVNFAVQKLGAKRAAILYPHDDWGLSGRDAFKKKFTQLGGQVIAEESYEKNDTDFKTQLSKIKNKKPDILYFTGFGNALGIIAKQSVEIGIKSYRLTTTGFNDKAILALAGNAAEGIYLTTSAFDPDKTEPAVSDFVTAFKKKFGRKPAFDEALQYDTVKLIALAIERGGNASEGIRRELSMVANYPGVCGTTSVSAKGDFETPIVLKVIKEGKVIHYSD